MKKRIHATGLTLGLIKWHDMTYTWKHLIKYTYSINNTNIEEIVTFNDLGVQFTYNLSWENAIVNTTKDYKNLA